ncbi:ankyrin repeat domain-containing protein [Mycena rebaudengoi]|nr:ankyrin repeat domain-containing protein [Mycena rebaudengoi]
MWLVLDIWDAGQQQQKNHEQERKKIIEWISLLNFFQRHDDISCARQEGTGLWLLEEDKFKDWVSGAGAIFWCYGMPGAGKTVLSSAVVDYLREKFPSPNVGVACTYLNHKEMDMQTPKNILAGLWRQLIFGKPILLGSPAHSLYHKHLEKQTRPSVDEMHVILSSTVADYSKVYFIIDALDEYLETKRHVLLKHLALYLAALRPNINLLFTSRPHITPEMFFPSTPALEIRATEEDIRRYLDAQIENSFQLSKHVQSRPELCQEIENKIIGNVDGMFLLAKLHIDSLTTRNTIKAVREALKNLPIDLEHTYNEAMDRIEAQGQDDRNIAKRVLVWIANAKRPLSVAELLEAIAIEPGTKTLDRDGLLDPDIFFSVCAGLVVLNHADGSVRFIHYTTQDYMDHVQTSKFPYAQTEMAQGCLTYLLYDDFLQLPDSFDELDALVQEHPLLDYSFHYSLVHSAGQPELILQDMILAFLAHASRWLSKFRPFITIKQYTPSSWDIYKNDLNISTDLFISALFNLEETAKYILAYDTSIRDQHKEQSLIGGTHRNALQATSFNGHEAVVQLLIDQGANMNALGGFPGNALQAASVEGHEVVVQLFLDRGTDVNAQGGFYGNALQVASRNGHEAVVQLLLNRGADVNAQGGFYGNALQAASRNVYEAVVELLLNRGAEVNAQGGYYGTALQAASFYGNVLQVASRNGHEAVVQLLLDRGADVNAQGGFYGNALQAASRNGYEAVVELLLNRGAEVNAQGGHYGTALQAASYEGYDAVVQLLLDRGADVNAQGGEFGNALQAASYEGHEEVIQLLLANGALLKEDLGSHEEEEEE